MTLPQLRAVLRDMAEWAQSLRSMPNPEVTRKIHEAGLALASLVACQAITETERETRTEI